MTVFNPAPGGGQSNAIVFPIGATPTPTASAGPSATANPAPGLISMSPTTAAAGEAAFTLTVTGGNFVPSSIVRWEGTNRLTTYVSATTLRASITASDIINGGNYDVTVMNPAPGGGTSNALVFVVTGPTATATMTRTPTPTNNPAPFITDVTPATLMAGSPGQNVTITGTGFAPNSQARWGGPGRATTYASPTQLTMAVTSSDLASAGTFAITVVNPSPGGGTSNSFNFVVATPSATPSPTRTATATIAPSFTPTPDLTGTAAANQTATAGVPLTQTAAVNQTGTAQARTETATAGVPLTQTAAANQTATATAGVPLTQTQAANQTATATALTATANAPTATRTPTATNNPAPFITDVQPSSALRGSEGQDITITGTGFVPGSQVRWSSTGRATTYVSATELTASITSSDLASAGTFAITVVNPSPGGGTSNSFNFVVATDPTATPTRTVTATNNPAPFITDVAPSSAAVGSAGQDLTLTGTGFAPNSQARWSGVGRATTYVSATELTMTVTSSDLASAGTFAITVVTPSTAASPGGGTSNSFNFVVAGTATPTRTPTRTPDLTTTEGVQAATAAARTATAAANLTGTANALTQTAGAPTSTGTATSVPTSTRTPTATVNAETATAAALTATANGRPPTGTGTATTSPTPTRTATATPLPTLSGVVLTVVGSLQPTATATTAPPGGSGTAGDFSLTAGPGGSGGAGGTGGPGTGVVATATPTPTASASPSQTPTTAYSEEGRKLTVRTYVDYNGNGAQDEVEGANAVMIVVTNDEAKWRQRIATTNGVAVFTLPRLPAGSVVTIRVPYLHRVARLTLDAGKTDIPATLALPPATYPLVLP